MMSEQDLRKRAARGGALLALAVALNAWLMPRRHLPHVTAETVRSAPLELIVRAPGSIQPRRVTVIKAEFDAPVVRKNYSESQTAAEGSFLVEIGRDYILTNHIARENDFKNSQVEVKKAQRELKLQKALFKKQAIAQAAIEDAAFALDKAEQALQTAHASYDLEQQRWSKNIVNAPFSGTIIKDSLGSDKNVSAGRELLVIGDVSAYVMEVKVGEIDIAQVHEGQTADIRVQAAEDRRLTGHVIQVGSHAEDRVYLVRIILDSTNGLPLLPQFSGEARIAAGATEQILTVPLSAVGAREGKRVVWTLDSFGRMHAQTVELGRSNPERVEITKGLAAGQRICATAQTSFRNFMGVFYD